MWVWKVLEDIRHKVSRILTWKVSLSVVLSITDNSLGPEQKCENISLLKIASLFPFVQAPESDKRERNWQNMFIISPICYPAVDSLDVTTFSYCFWIVHTDFDTEGNYFLVLWNFIQHLTSFGFCLTKFWSSCKHFWTKIFFLYDPLLSKDVAHCAVIYICVRQHDILKPRLCLPSRWPSVNLPGLTGGHICHTANISGNPNIIEYD